MSSGLVLVVILVAAAVVLGVVGVALASDRIVERMVRARPPEGPDDERLATCAEALCLGAGLPLPHLRVIDDDAPSALAYGRSPRIATVAVTTGLLATASPVELEAALAHLLSRIAGGTARRDTWLAAAGRLGGPLGLALAAWRRDSSRVVAADIAATRLTRFPPGVVEMLDRMAAASGTLGRYPSAVAHLWMHDALGAGGRRVPLADRITALADL